MPVMIGGVIAAIVVAAGAGLVFAGGNDGPQPTTPSFPTPGPTQIVVVPTAGPLVSLQPLPTAGPVSPTAVPVTPTPNPGGSQTISVDTVAITVPSTWEVIAQDETFIALYVPGSGQLIIESWPASQRLTAAQLLEDEVAFLRSKHPDVTVCVPEGDFTLPNGPDGRKIGLCYTATTSSGSTYQATDFFAFGISHGGTIGYYFSMYAGDEDYDSLLQQVVTVLPGLEWKLFTGN
jgi:hypothetical protein